MLTLAYAERQEAGIADLLRLVLAMFGVLGFTGSLFAAALTLKSHSGFEWAHILLPLAVVGASFSWLLLRRLFAWLRRNSQTLRTPAAPWLLLGGVLVFAAVPAVRVDCRGLQEDDFLSYGSDFQGSLTGPRWVRQPAQLPDRNELPADFVVAGVSAGVVGCQRTPFSWERVQPLLLVRLTDKVQPGMTTYAAAQRGRPPQADPVG